MFRYTTWYINGISLLISIIVFSLINFFILNFDQITLNSNFKAGFKVESQEINSEKENKLENEILLSKENQNLENSEEEKNKSWYLEIPNINLKAQISDGTTKEVLDDYIGHFEETTKWVGNIGLAAHNRGYKNNYFENVKKLKEGDEIYYYYKGEKRKYSVKNNFIISNTDWSYLESTEINTITLITCVENEPTYRRCVRAEETT